jgi:cytochrome bd-type quinol oxidase subunit 2
MCAFKRSKTDNKLFGGKRLMMERAVEPTDIIWENMYLSTKYRSIRGFLTYFITALALGGSLTINYFIGTIKDGLENQAKEGDHNAGYFFLIGAINISNGLIVSSINFLLGRIVRILTHAEKHTSYTSYHLSVMVKLVLAMYVNTAIIPLLINSRPSQWFTSSGLSADIFFNTLAVCFFGPIVYIWTPAQVLKSIKKRREQKKGPNSLLSQIQANELYE